MSDTWIQNIIDRSQPLSVGHDEQAVIDKLIALAYSDQIGMVDVRIVLAAMFDLLIMAEYYRDVGHVGWFYCPAENRPLFTYPYTNACPRCVLTNQFVHHKANKPKSGAIGAKTSRLLAIFLQNLFVHNKHSVKVRKGVEPVDLVLIDESQSPVSVLFAEIKAAPLLTLPLAVSSQQFSESENDEHRESTHHSLYGSELSILLPDSNQAHEIVPFGMKQDADDQFWAYRSLLTLLETDDSFIIKYVAFWKSAFTSYKQKSQSGIFWLTNGCGQPSPRPQAWKRRAGASGFESISDSKTSVGMDRTDDLKKATYQLLKLGAEGHPTVQYHYRVGLISNIHAVRHHDDYLTAIQDIVWTRYDAMKNVETAADLPPDTPLFNLFDGIIALTETRIRDKWVRDLFDFERGGK